MREMCFSVLLLSCSSLRALVANECILGVIGESAFLPCVYNGAKNWTSLYIWSEWRRGSEVIHNAGWIDEKPNVSHSIRGTVSSLAPKSGDFTIELHDIRLSDAHNYSLHLKFGEISAVICNVCLTVAGHFSHPVLLRHNGANEKETQFVCNTRGGFPAPTINWLINHTQHGPETTISTYMNTLPDSELYNITSVLTVNVPQDTAVSCVVENSLLNETLTETNSGFSAAERRLSGALWIFSIILCVIVLILVSISLGFQRKWDRDRQRELHRRGDDSCSEDTEMIMDLDRWATLPETVV